MPAHKTTRRPAPTALPLGLQVITRYCFPGNWDLTGLSKRLRKADAYAARLVTSPMGESCDGFFTDAIDALDLAAITELPRAALLAYFHARPGNDGGRAESLTTDRLADITELPLQEGFLLGLCVAHRVHLAMQGGAK